MTVNLSIANILEGNIKEISSRGEISYQRIDYDFVPKSVELLCNARIEPKKLEIHEPRANSPTCYIVRFVVSPIRPNWRPSSLNELMSKLTKGVDLFPSDSIEAKYLYGEFGDKSKWISLPSKEYLEVIGVNSMKSNHSYRIGDKLIELYSEEYDYPLFATVALHLVPNLTIMQELVDDGKEGIGDRRSWNLQRIKRR